MDSIIPKRGLVSEVKPAVDNRVERQIITAMVVSDHFCQSIKPLWRQSSLTHPAARRIGQWCIEYFDRYSKAPGVHIQDLYANEKPQLDISESDAISGFLSDISSEYEERSEVFNFDYALDTAEKYFRLTSLQTFREDLKQRLMSGEPESAEALISSYVRPSRPLTRGVNPIADIISIRKAFELQVVNTLIQLPGVLGDPRNMIGPMGRGELMAIVGPAGVGKTWWMLWIGLTAALAGYNVAFFSFEMPWEQITRRLQSMVTGLPKKELSGRVLIPVWDCQANQYGTCIERCRENSVTLIANKNKPEYDRAPLGYRPCSVCREREPQLWYPDSWFREEYREEISDAAISAKHRALVTNIGKRMGDFHITSAPSGSMSINDVKTYLKNREYYDGIVTDLTITDSADKMRPAGMYSDKDPRHGIYGIWMGHKAMAEEMHMGVLTASHSNTERTQRRVRQGDWAEDIRKLRESDLAFAPNQNAAQGVAGQYSVNMLKKRDLPLNQWYSTLVLSCLTVGKPYLDSAHERRMARPKDEK